MKLTTWAESGDLNHINTEILVNTTLAVQCMYYVFSSYIFIKCKRVHNSLLNKWVMQTGFSITLICPVRHSRHTNGTRMETEAPPFHLFRLMLPLCFLSYQRPQLLRKPINWICTPPSLNSKPQWLGWTWRGLLQELSRKGPKAYTSITAIVCWIIQHAGLTFKVH